MPKQKLTIRQFQVWLQLARGLSDQQIAHRLSLNIYTLRDDLRYLYRFLGVRNRTQAALAFVFVERLR